MLFLSFHSISLFTYPMLILPKTKRGGWDSVIPFFSIPSEALGYSFQEHEKEGGGSVIHLWSFWEELQELDSD